MLPMTSAATTQLQLDGISVIVSESFSLFHHCLPAPPCIYHCTSNLRLCHFFRKLCIVLLPLRIKPKFLPWQKDSTLPSNSPLVALLISFPKTLPITYSLPVTLAGQAILLFLQHLRLAVASGLCVGCSLLVNCSPLDICWRPLLIWNFLYEAYSDFHILKYSQISSILICFLFPPYH